MLTKNPQVEAASRLPETNSLGSFLILIETGNQPADVNGFGNASKCSEFYDLLDDLGFWLIRHDYDSDTARRSIAAERLQYVATVKIRDF